MEGDAGKYVQKNKVSFQSTPSVWRETCGIFCWIPVSVRFQSTPSVWRETTELSAKDEQFAQFQSTPSVWRETERR